MLIRTQLYLDGDEVMQNLGIDSAPELVDCVVVCPKVTGYFRSRNEKAPGTCVVAGEGDMSTVAMPFEEFDSRFSQWYDNA